MERLPVCVGPGKTTYIRKAIAHWPDRCFELQASFCDDATRFGFISARTTKNWSSKLTKNGAGSSGAHGRAWNGCHFNARSLNYPLDAIVVQLVARRVARVVAQGVAQIFAQTRIRKCKPMGVTARENAAPGG